LVVLAVAGALQSVRAGLYGDDHILLGILSGTTLAEVYRRDWTSSTSSTVSRAVAPHARSGAIAMMDVS